MSFSPMQLLAYKFYQLDCAERKQSPARWWTLPQPVKAKWIEKANRYFEAWRSEEIDSSRRERHLESIPAPERIKLSEQTRELLEGRGK